MSLFVNTGKASWIPSCFHLIYLSSPLHTKHITELERTKEFKVVGLNEAGLKHIAHLGNTTWDRLEKPEWHLYYEDQKRKRKKASLTFSLGIKFGLPGLSTGL